MNFKFSVHIALLLCIFVLPSFLMAGERGMTRDFDLTYETRRTEGTEKVDIDRFTLNSKFGWELTRRSKLDVSIPFCMTSADFDVNPLDDDSIAAFKDMKIDYRVDVREATDEKPGAFYDIHMNLPTGLSKLSDDEQAILNAINEAAEGFSEPAYTYGFGLRAMYGMSFKQGANGKLDVSLGYHFTAPYDASDTTERDTSDNVLLKAIGSRQINPNRLVEYGMSYMYFFDGDFTDDAGSTTSTDRDGDFNVYYGMSTKLNPNLSNSIDFMYSLRGEQDYVDAGGTSFREIELGDIISLNYMQHQKMKPDTWFDYGLAWRWTMDADFITGTDVDTERNELGLVLGMTKQVNDGLNLKGSLQIGLTDDSRDMVFQFGGAWNY